MSDKRSISKGTCALMAVLALAVVGFAFFKARHSWERDASARCRTRLESISALLGAWKGSHQGQFPSDLASLESMLSLPHPQRWMCPSDTDHSSYIFTFPGEKEYDKQAVFVPAASTATSASQAALWKNWDAASISKPLAPAPPGIFQSSIAFRGTPAEE